MTQGITPNGIITLTPDEGMGITDGEIVAMDTVFLGKFDSPARWRDCELPETQENGGGLAGMFNVNGL